MAANHSRASKIFSFFSPVLTRELIYTAITWAREAVEIWGVDDVFRDALSRHIERRSGLREALWGD